MYFGRSTILSVSEDSWGGGRQWRVYGWRYVWTSLWQALFWSLVLESCLPIWFLITLCILSTHDCCPLSDLIASSRENFPLLHSSKLYLPTAVISTDSSEGWGAKEVELEHSSSSYGSENLLRLMAVAVVSSSPSTPSPKLHPPSRYPRPSPFFVTFLSMPAFWV